MFGFGVSAGTSCVARSPGSRGTKIKKIMYDAAENDDFDREEVATYEEVRTEETGSMASSGL